MRIAIVGALLAMIALAACSGGEELAEEPPARAALPTVAATDDAAAIDAASPEGTANPVTIEEMPPVATPTIAATESGYEEWLAERERRLAPYPRPPNPDPTPTLRTMEFPDDIALIAREYPSTHIGREGLKSSELLRIYKQSGDLVVREVLFSDADIEGSIFKYAATPDASTIVVNICIDGSCTSSYGPADGRTTFYQSRDGGVTWEHLVSFDNPWNIETLLPSGSDETRLLLRNANSFDYMLWPGGLSITPPDPPEGHDILGVVLLSDGRITWGMNNNTSSLPIFLAGGGEDLTELVLEQLTPECPSCSMASRWSSLGRWYFYGGGTVALEISDGLYIRGWDDAEYSPEQLRGAAAASFTEEDVGDKAYWPTLRNLQTGEERPIKLPADVLTLGNTLLPLTIQSGPFLRVASVGDGCLPIVAEPSPDAEELACAAERVLLQDLGESAEVNGLTLHKVRTPAGIEGWANDRYLAGDDDFVIAHEVEDCLALRAGPGLYADIVDCVPSGTVIKHDRQDPRTVIADGIIWHRLEWEGDRVWADSSMLRGTVSVQHNSLIVTGDDGTLYESIDGGYNLRYLDYIDGQLASPAVELPEDIAMVGFAAVREHGGYFDYFHSVEMIRVYKGPEGELVRDTLFRPEGGKSTIFSPRSIATDDLSRIVVEASGTLYESIDGGVSWRYLGDAWSPGLGFGLVFVPGENVGDPERVLSVTWWIHGNDDSVFTIHPTGERETLPPFEDWNKSELGRLYIAARDSTPPNPLPDMNLWNDGITPGAWLSDSKFIGVSPFSETGLIWGGAMEGGTLDRRCCEVWTRRPWPAIYDLETETASALIMPGVFHGGQEFASFVGLQQGPFLRVINVGDDCLPLRADPLPEAAELACVTERVLLQDQGDVVTDDGVTWREVRTPAGVEGWADGGYLE